MGGLVFGEGGVLGRREGGLVMDFYVLLTIGWDFSLGLFFSFSPFLSFREGRFVSLYFFSCLLPFFFSFPFFHFCLFSFPDENHQRLESGAIPSNH